jgi:hypothetical protein
MDAGEIKLFLSGRLPDYMMPAIFVAISELPLTFNGKTDKDALLNMQIEMTNGISYHSPVTGTEKQVAIIWKKILLTERIGIDDNFFDIGGNSLLCVRLKHEMEVIFKKEMAVTLFFQYSTIRSFANYLEGNENDNKTQLKNETRINKRRNILSGLK